MDSPRAITKILLPEKRGTLLHRPRLTNFLLEHIDRKLLLVSASAGELADLRKVDQLKRDFISTAAQVLTNPLELM